MGSWMFLPLLREPGEAGDAVPGNQSDILPPYSSEVPSIAVTALGHGLKLLLAPVLFGGGYVEGLEARTGPGSRRGL
jgi:hypothetical protein